MTTIHIIRIINPGSVRSFFVFMYLILTIKKKTGESYKPPEIKE